MLNTVRGKKKAEEATLRTNARSSSQTAGTGRWQAPQCGREKVSAKEANVIPYDIAQRSTWQNVNTGLHVFTSPSTSAVSKSRARVEGLFVSNVVHNSADKFNGHRHGCFIREGDLWLSNPSLMPDSLLDLPTPKAISEILRKTSLEMISSLSYQQYVHLSPGVHLPKELSFQLSVGAKYMFHQPTQVDLIRKSWGDFNRRLRWRLKFLFEKTGEQP